MLPPHQQEARGEVHQADTDKFRLIETNKQSPAVGFAIGEAPLIRGAFHVFFFEVTANSLSLQERP
jgi:hypothetical protein